MNLHDAIELAKALGGLTNLVTLYRWVRNTPGRFPSEESQRSILGDLAHPSAEAERNIDELFDESDYDFIRGLPKEIGDAANRRLKRTLERYRKAIDSQMNFLELDREADLAAEEICNFLRLLIRRHGDLPTEEWRDLWRQFKCEDEPPADDLQAT